MATDFEIEVLRELRDIKSICASNEANWTALNQRLFQNPTGVIPVMQEDIKSLKDADLSTRLTTMEDDLKDHKKWQNIKLISASVIQAVGALIGIHYKGHP